MVTRQLIDEFQTTWNAMKAAMDDTKNDTRIAVRQMNARLDQLETALKRPPLDFRASAYDPSQPPDPNARLFFKMVAAGGPGGMRDSGERAQAERLMRDIETKMAPSEVKALSLGDDTASGFLAPSEFSREIVKGVQELSPLRSVAKVRPTSARSVQIPVRSGVFAASWVGETGTRSETTGLSYSMEDITPSEMYAYVLVSLQDLEDAAFDLQAEIAAEAAEQFAKAEGKAFISGSGVRQPEGILSNAAVDHIASGHDDALTADGLINLVYSLKESYARRATFLLRRATVGAIRLLKDLQDRYIWEPNYQAGSPPTILGIPYLECPDVPTVAGGAFPVLLGDWSRAYQIVDRVDISVQRLAEKFAETGQVGFLIRKRVGGQIILPEACLKQEVAAS